MGIILDCKVPLSIILDWKVPLSIILDCKVPLNQKLAKMSQVKVVNLKIILSIKKHFSGSIYWNFDPENSNAVNYEYLLGQFTKKQKNTCKLDI